MTEGQFWQSIAERPADRSLRFVLADWLQDQSDPRGEALALALKARRTTAESKRLRRLQRAHLAGWLGPLAEHAVLEGCEVHEGLLREVTLKPDLPAATYRALADEPRLKLVQRLRLSPGRFEAEAEGLLGAPTLAGLTLLGADAATFRRLRQHPVLFAPEEYELHVRHVGGALDDELLAVGRASTLSLVSDEFMSPQTVAEVARVAGRSGGERRQFALKVAYGTIEGAAQWLLSGTEQPHGEWSVRFNETVITLRSSLVEVDLRGAGGRFELGSRVATAASVLALLEPLQLTLIEVVPSDAEPLGRVQLEVLRAAQRRLPTVLELRVAGVS